MVVVAPDAAGRDALGGFLRRGRARERGSSSEANAPGAIATDDDVVLREAQTPCGA